MVGQLQYGLACLGVAGHFETLCVTNEFVRCSDEFAAMNCRFFTVFVNFLPGIQNNPGLGCYPARKMLPEFLFLAFVVHAAPACFFVIGRPAPVRTIFQP